jgi:glyoxylase-like metal-dependent hydrolase (beta-lactamase superfamily II)
LIDTGWNDNQAFTTLEEQLVELGVKFKDITQIVATHCHPDHYGLADKLKRLCQAKLFLHQLDKELIESRWSSNISEYLMRMANWLQINGMPADDLPQVDIALPDIMSRMSFAKPDVILHGGENLSTGSFNFEVIWTPGHSPGHICLYDADRKILLSGDHVLPVITPNVSLRSQSEGNPLGDYIRSLCEVGQLDVDLVLPAHEHIFGNLKDRVEQILLHHEQRKAAILALLKNEHRTGFQIASGIPWMTDTLAVGFDHLGSMDRRMAVLETLAHLELLRAEGEVQEFSLEGIVFYGHKL